MIFFRTWRKCAYYVIIRYLEGIGDDQASPKDLGHFEEYLVMKKYAVHPQQKIDRHGQYFGNDNKCNYTKSRRCGTDKTGSIPVPPDGYGPNYG